LIDFCSDFLVVILIAYVSGQWMFVMFVVVFVGRFFDFIHTREKLKFGQYPTKGDLRLMGGG